MEPQVFYLDGVTPVELSEQESKIARINQTRANDLGYDIYTSTLTQISKKILKQKFFQVAPADFVNVIVGEGAWMSNILTYQSYASGGDFSTGLIQTAANNARLASVDAGIDSVNQVIRSWAKEITWSLPELQFASKNTNFSIVEAKQESRKMNWDLGIQKVTFLGLDGDTKVLGLLNQAGVTIDTATITKKISAMTAAELKTFIGTVLSVYRANAAYTSWPTHFLIPESDFLGLAAPSNADYPLKSIMEVMLETFKTMTSNQGFKILPIPYADAVNNTYDRQVYVMYNIENVTMHIPVDYTSTVANTINGFQYQDVAYGQFTGVMAYRPKEVIYFKYDPTP